MTATRDDGARHPRGARPDTEPPVRPDARRGGTHGEAGRAVALPAVGHVGLVRAPPGLAGTVVVDLAGSTPSDPVVRVYRAAEATSGSPTFLGCASPVWNALLALEVPVAADDIVLAQVGTSESREGASSSASRCAVDACRCGRRVAGRPARYVQRGAAPVMAPGRGVRTERARCRTTEGSAWMIGRMRRAGV